MTDIGNGHQQAPAFSTTNPGGFAINSIVKIASVFTVNRDQGNVSQVDAAFFIFGTHGIWQSAGERERSIAEFMRHTIFTHRNFNLHAGVVNFAQHFLNAANRLPKQRRRFCQLHHHYLP